MSGDLASHQEPGGGCQRGRQVDRLAGHTGHGSFRKGRLPSEPRFRQGARWPAANHALVPDLDRQIIADAATEHTGHRVVCRIGLGGGGRRHGTQPIFRRGTPDAGVRCSQCSAQCGRIARGMLEKSCLWKWRRLVDLAVDK